MPSIIYSLTLAIFFIANIPKIFFEIVFKKKNSWKYWRHKFNNGISINRDHSKKLVWIHAVSVGETKMISPIAKWITDNVANTEILISSVTMTGHQAAKKYIPQAIGFIFLPLDFSTLIKPLVKQLKPSWTIISETDFWLNFIKSTKNCGSLLFLINGKISKKSFKKFAMMPFLTKKIFQNFDMLLVQDDNYRRQFIALGANKDSVFVTGNVKISQEYCINSTEIMSWKQTLNINDDDIAISLGSTHDSEELSLLQILSPLLKKYHKLKIIVTPRHPERFQRVAKIIKNFHHQHSILSEGISKDSKIILIDTMGKLCHCYQISSLSIVGGSFISTVGGHNIVEPIACGSPAIYGPYIYKQNELHLLVKKFSAGIQTTLPSLEKVIDNILCDKSLIETLRIHGKNLIKQSKEPLTSTINFLKGKL